MEKKDIYNVDNIEVDIDKEELPVFRGISLPENFLQLINKPLNINFIQKSGEEKLICLATGNIVNRHYIRSNIPIPKGLTFQPVLIADSSRISATGVWRQNHFIFHSGIYKSDRGVEDVGFANGDPVFLDHEKYIDLMDEFLSGSLYMMVQNQISEKI